MPNWVVIITGASQEIGKATAVRGSLSPLSVGGDSAVFGPGSYGLDVFGTGDA